MAERETGQIPDNHVLAVFKGAVAEDGVAAELRQAGFNDFTMMDAADVEEKVDPGAEHKDPITKAIKRVMDHLSEQVAYLEQYEDEARQGNRVIAVAVEDANNAQAVKEILERHHATDIRFFGKLAVTDMTPRSNPSAPSDQLP